MEPNYKDYKCKDCIFFAKGILCCMAMENEGMRVWDENQQACQYFVKYFYVGD